MLLSVSLSYYARHGSTSFLESKNPQSRDAQIWIITVIAICSLYFTACLVNLGPGTRATSVHVARIQFPSYFIEAFLDGTKKDDRLQVLGFLEGHCGSVSWLSSFHQKSRKSENKSSDIYEFVSKNFYSNNPCDHYGILLERRGVQRIFGFFNFLGFLQFIPRLFQLQQSLSDDGFADSRIHPKNMLFGIRSMCMLSLLLDIPYALRVKGAVTIEDVLGTGSEKTVFGGVCSVAESKLNLAMRMNTPLHEHQYSCIVAGSLTPLLYRYQDKHLISPVMTTATIALADFNPYKLLDFTSQVCAGLRRLHDSGFIHRDVKLNNILAVQTLEGPRYMLADFGHAAAIGHSVTCSTKGYADPMHVYMPASAKLDVWCLGLSLLKLIADKSEANTITDRIKKFYEIFGKEKVDLKRSSSSSPHEIEIRYRKHIEDWSAYWCSIWHLLSDSEFRAKSFAFKDREPWNSSKPEDMIHYDVFSSDVVNAINRCMQFDLEARWGVEELCSWCRHWFRCLHNKAVMPYSSIFTKL